MAKNHEWKLENFAINKYGDRPAPCHRRANQQQKPSTYELVVLMYLCTVVIPNSFSNVVADISSKMLSRETCFWNNFGRTDQMLLYVPR